MVRTDLVGGGLERDGEPGGACCAGDGVGVPGAPQLGLEHVDRSGWGQGQQGVLVHHQDGLPRAGAGEAGDPVHHAVGHLEVVAAGEGARGPGRARRCRRARTGTASRSGPPPSSPSRSDSSRPANRGDQSAACSNVAVSTANSRSPVKPLILGIVRSTTVDLPASAARAAAATGSLTPKTLLAPTVGRDLVRRRVVGGGMEQQTVAGRPNATVAARNAAAEAGSRASRDRVSRGRAGAGATVGPAAPGARWPPSRPRSPRRPPPPAGTPP